MAKNAAIRIRVDEDTKAKLQAIADHDDRTLSYVAEQAIKDRIAFEEAQVRAIQVGLDAANRGEFIPHEDVKAWVESWDSDNELPAPEPRKV